MKAEKSDKTAFVMLMTSLVMSVILFGAVHAYTYSFVFLMIFTASLFLINKNIIKDLRTEKYSYSHLKTDLDIIFYLFLSYLLFQIILLPEFIVRAISPEALAVGKMARSPLRAYEQAKSAWFALSPYAYPVRQSFIRIVAYWLLFRCLVETLNTRARINTAVATILILGSFEALYGLIETYSGHSHILWFKRIEHIKDLSGTYINRNHFAGLMGIGLLLATGFAGALSEKKKKRSGIKSNWEKSFRTRLSELFSKDRNYAKKILVITSAIVMGLGLILSASRGGMISASIAMFFMGIMFLSKKEHRRKGFLLLTMFLVIFIYAYNVGIDYSLKRFDHISGDYETRKRYALKTFEIFEDYRITGAGIGNFQYLYPRYQSSEDKKQYFMYAHNDWLQFAAEAGITGFALLVTCISIYIYFTIKRWSARSNSYSICLGAVPLAVLAAMGIHSYSDFNLHIPANFMMMVSIAAIGYSALNLEKRYHNEKIRYKYISLDLNRKGKLLLLFFAGFILWSGIYSFRHLVAESLINTVPNSTLNRERYPSPGKISAAITWDGGNAEYRFRLAENLIIARNNEPDDKIRIEYLEKIIDALENAVRLNPMNAEYHLRLGWEYSHMWEKPDYHQKWIPAADIYMERAAYFAGEKNPNLHVELGNYWIMRSKTVDPSANRLCDSEFIRAGWHYQKAIELEPADKKLKDKIRKYIWNFYPDEEFLKTVISYR
ncbi:MAG: O-antigen ligase domain-containing protein [Desulfobacteraceae bacterium]|nr:MAG: O-antigen ligase domain-containing protein [Desulfobacteraceae bacterium]